VPLAWSERAAAALKAAGKDVTLHVYPGEPHEFIDAWTGVMQRTVAFFDQYVKN
jgi:dipeptidyl aminopeptidase/acylaminoacyl peptidase